MKTFSFFLSFFFFLINADITDNIQEGGTEIEKVSNYKYPVKKVTKYPVKKVTKYTVTHIWDLQEWKTEQGKKFP